MYLDCLCSLCLCGSERSWQRCWTWRVVCWGRCRGASLWGAEGSHRQLPAAPSHTVLTPYLAGESLECNTLTHDVKFCNWFFTHVAPVEFCGHFINVINNSSWVLFTFTQPGLYSCVVEPHCLSNHAQIQIKPCWSNLLLAQAHKQ